MLSNTLGREFNNNKSNTAVSEWSEQLCLSATDCYDHYKRGEHEDAVLVVRPAERYDVPVFCDMKDAGWTIIQRRLDGSNDFYRSWTDYELGFGSTFCCLTVAK